MTQLAELIPGLPEEIALECLTRLHYSTHRVASGVSKRWRYLLQSSHFYYLRKQFARTHKAACLIQSLPEQSSTSVESKSSGSPGYGVSILDPLTENWKRVDPLPEYPNGLPLFCRVTGSEGKIIIMGGWDPVSYKPLSHVFIYDFTTRKWRRGKDMPENRSLFAVGEIKGKVIIAGGHEVNKNALSSAWVYDVTRDEWTELPKMSQERDECEGFVVCGNEMWVVSGYRTESQGQFERSGEFIELGAGEWKRVEDIWRGSGSPKSASVEMDKEKMKLVSWSLPETEVRVRTCGVHSVEWTVVIGSTYEGGPQGLYMMMKGQNSKWKKLNVPEKFSGIVQSGCFVEI